MLFVGAYTALHLLSKVSPVDKIATILSGVIALVIWMARYQRSALYSLSLKPGIGPLIFGICRLTKEQPPVDPSLDAGAGHADGDHKEAEAEAARLLLHTDADFASATRQLKEAFKGNNDSIEVLVDQLRRNVQLRDSTSSQVALPPLGVFVLVGKPGLGKRSLAIETGHKLYKGSSVSIVDVNDAGVTGSLFVGEARSNPFTSFILDNFQNCPARLQEDLLSIFAGAPQMDAKTGAKVSFRHCFFFLLVQRDAEAMQRPKRQQGGTGQTVVVESLNTSMSIDKRLSWSVHGIYPFVLPQPLEQAEVVAKIMQAECEKYRISIGHIDPSILAREVQVVSSHGGFEITPSRVTKLLNQRLLSAVAAHEELIDVSDPAVMRYAGNVYSRAGQGGGVWLN